VPLATMVRKRNEIVHHFASALDPRAVSGMVDSTSWNRGASS